MTVVDPAPARVNLGELLPRHAASAPARTAIIAPDGKQGWLRCSYAELEARASRVASGLASMGVLPGDRAVVFVRPGIDLVVVFQGLLRLGAVPVVADPGMGRERLLACLAKVSPKVFIGVPRAHVARRLFPRFFSSVELAVTVGRRLFWGGPTLDQVEAAGSEGHPPADTAADDPAAILFTSGSTGPPKGVEYTHGMFCGQVEALKQLYDFQPDEIDMCGLPVFALFDAALEMTSLFPEVDPSHPGTCDPARVYAAVAEHKPTTAFGSPAIWRRVVPWCRENGYHLHSLKRVLVAGAPVPTDLMQEFHALLRLDSDVFTPYGATEALPVASIAGREVVPSLEPRVHGGEGTCVGLPAPGIEIRLIQIDDNPIAQWSADLEVSTGEVGEVCVRGTVVTHSYAEQPEQDAAAKIADGDSTWHRMGDIGRFDEDGRLWFLGRKGHRLFTSEGLRMPVPVENVFNVHERTHRTALVGVGPRGQQHPVLIVEPKEGEMPKGEVMRKGFIMQLRTLGKRCKQTKDIKLFLFHPSLPVDPRHNAKIHREELKVWAEEQLGKS